MNEMELQQAFDRVRCGDREAFVQIYRELSRPVYTVVLRILRQREAAEDVMQELFLRLYADPPGKEIKNLRAWIFRVAHNLAIDALRSRRITTEDIPEKADEEEIRRIDLRMDIARAMSRLSLIQRQIVSLHVYGELTFAQIAPIVGLSPAATFRAWRQALKRLREELGE